MLGVNLCLSVGNFTAQMECQPLGCSQGHNVDLACCANCKDLDEFTGTSLSVGVLGDSLSAGHWGQSFY